MDLLVTGGCGYIGSALIPLLCEDDRVNRVVVLDDFSTGSPRTLMGCVEDIEFRQSDIREYGDVESAVRDVDGIVHLAAITGAGSTHDRREETYETNLEGTRNVLTAAGKVGIERVVLASSCNIYGRATSTDIDETTEPDPINPYAETKYEAEKLLFEYGSEHDMDGTALRLSTVYGDAPGIRFNLVVNQFVFRALTDRPLTVYGDGSNWRPFIHVEDAARAYCDAMLRPEAWSESVYNVGGGAENYRIRDVATLISEEIDAVDVTYLEDEHPGPSYHVNFDRVGEMGFELAYTLREGVRELAGRFSG